MIRTTVSLDENLYKEARKKAIDERKAFAEVINEALERHLGKKRANKGEKKAEGIEFLEKVVELGKRNPVKGAPKDLVKNFNKYLWDEYYNN